MGENYPAALRSTRAVLVRLQPAHEAVFSSRRCVSADYQSISGTGPPRWWPGTRRRKWEATHREKVVISDHPQHRFRSELRVVCTLGAAALVAVLGACVPPVPAPPAEAVLAGRWVFPGSAIDSELHSLQLTFDENGTAVRVEYQFGDDDPVLEEDVQGSVDADGALVALIVGFGANNVSFDGVLNASSSAASGYVSLFMEVDGIAVRMMRESARLTRTTALQPGQGVPAGTWSLTAPSSQIQEVLLDFDDAGAPILFSSRVGSNARRTDTVLEGSATVESNNVSIDLSMPGSLNARGYFRFTGILEREDRLLTGAISLRQSAGNTTVTATDRSAVLARLTNPPTGAAFLQGTWEFVSPGDDPPLTTLLLMFDAQNRLARIVFQGLGQDEFQFTDLATRTDEDGGIVTVKASFSGGRSLFFDGVIDGNQETLVGWLSLDILGTTLSQEPAIFVKQSEGE